MKFLLTRSHQAGKIIVKRLILGRNNATKVWVDPRLCDWGHHSNDPLAYQPRCLLIIFTGKTNLILRILTRRMMPASKKRKCDLRSASRTLGKLKPLDSKVKLGSLCFEKQMWILILGLTAPRLR